jgi:hypothetical protein
MIHTLESVMDFLREIGPAIRFVHWAGRTFGEWTVQ